MPNVLNPTSGKNWVELSNWVYGRLSQNNPDKYFYLQLLPFPLTLQPTYALVTLNCYLLFLNILYISMLPLGHYLCPKFLSTTASLMKSFSFLRPNSNVTSPFISHPYFFFLGRMNLLLFWVPVEICTYGTLRNS